MNTTDDGAREKLTCNLPFDQSNGRHLSAVEKLCERLAAEFGGYTCTPFVGGWRVADGSALHEVGLAFDVSYAPSEAKRKAAKTLFIEAGAACDQTDIHLERSAFDAEHEKVSGGK